MWDNVRCSESGVAIDTAVLCGTAITERCSHVFLCRAANSARWKRQSAAPSGLFSFSCHCGEDNRVRLALWTLQTLGIHFISGLFERLYPHATVIIVYYGALWKNPSGYCFSSHLWLWKNPKNPAHSSQFINDAALLIPSSGNTLKDTPEGARTVLSQLIFFFFPVTFSLTSLRVGVVFAGLHGFSQILLIKSSADVFSSCLPFIMCLSCASAQGLEFLKDEVYERGLSEDLMVQLNLRFLSNDDALGSQQLNVVVNSEGSLERTSCS